MGVPATQVRPPVQEFLRECQCLLDDLQSRPRLTALEQVLLNAYVRRVTAFLETDGHEPGDLPSMLDDR